MKCASVPSEYRKLILRDSVRTGRNFSPARNVRSITAPSSARLSLVRTNAPPLPGFTCWNSTILKTVPSTSIWVPFLNWLVLIICDGKARACARTPCDDNGGGMHGRSVGHRAGDGGRARPARRVGHGRRCRRGRL